MARRVRWASPPEIDFKDESLPANAPPDMVKQHFARRLWRATLKKGWNQAELARQSGLGRDSISMYMRGRSLPEPLSATKLADALGMKVSDLIPQAAESAVDMELPAAEMRQSSASGMAWLRINQEVPFAVAVQILSLLQQSEQG